jgi:hypothetical protein
VGNGEATVAHVTLSSASAGAGERVQHALGRERLVQNLGAERL